MAHFNKQRKKWMYDFEINGKRRSKYIVHPETGKEPRNKTEAVRFETLIRAKAFAQPESTPHPPGDFTVGMAFDAFTTRKKGGGNWENQKVYIAELARFFGLATPVRDITEQTIWEYIAHARRQPIMVYMGGGKTKSEAVKLRRDSSLYRPCKSGRTRADSTINRYLDCLRETLRIAYSLRDSDGRMLLSNPVPVVPDLTEPEKLPRPIPDDVLWQMADRAPAHLAWGILLARLMGFRKGEMFALTIQQVDFQNGGIWLAAEDTKAKRDEFIPAGREALELLTYLVAEAIARKTEHLITYRRRLRRAPGEKVRFTEPVPIKNPRTAWRRVMKELGVAGFHKFHHTKASFVTAIAHNATAAVTQELARHRDYRTTQRYLKVNNQAARAAVDAASIRVPTATALAPSPKQESQTEDPMFGEMTAKSLNLMVGAAGFEPTTPSPPD